MARWTSGMIQPGSPDGEDHLAFLYHSVRPGEALLWFRKATEEVCWMPTTLGPELRKCNPARNLVGAVVFSAYADKREDQK